MSLYYQTCLCEDCLWILIGANLLSKKIVKTNNVYVWISDNLHFHSDTFHMDNEEHISMYNYLPLSCHIKKYKLESAMYNE